MFFEKGRWGVKEIVADFNITRDIGELEISGLELFGNNTGFDFCECINILQSISFNRGFSHHISEVISGFL